MIAHLLVLAYVSKEVLTAQYRTGSYRIPPSPCPDTFFYENNTEPDKWFGVVNIQTSEELVGVWLSIQLDNEAELLGNWFGESYSTDNKEFRISNPDYVLEAGPPVAIRFFVKFNTDDAIEPIPKLEKIRLNGKTICSPKQEYKPTTPRLHISKTKTTTPLPPSTGTGTTYGFDQSDNKPTTKIVNVNGNNFVPQHQPTGGTAGGTAVNYFPFGGTGKKDPDVFQPATPRPTQLGFSSSGRPATMATNRYSEDPAGPYVVTRPSRVTNRPPTEGTKGTTLKETASFHIKNTNQMSEDDRNRPSKNKKPAYNFTSWTRPTFSLDVTPETPSDSSNNRVDENTFYPNYGATSTFSLDITEPSVDKRNNNRNRSENSNQPNARGSQNEFKDNEQEEDFFPGDFNVLKVTGKDGYTRRRPILDAKKTVACGTVALRPKALISYGQDTSPGEWPWHAAIYHTKGIQLVYICGASLISDRHVLTAAHCVCKPRSTKKVDPEGILVYFGKYNLRTFGPETQDRDVEDIYIHPEFNYSVYYNDIAIIKLSRPVDITDYVRPCCLWEENTELETIINKEGVVIGWGFDEHKQISERLLQANMPVVSTIKCIYSNRDFFARFTFDKNFCAGFRNGTSVCNGDSGGSMVFPKRGTSGQTTSWQIRGIVSVGVALQTEGICDTSQYVIFTDVAKHLTWIKHILET